MNSVYRVGETNELHGVFLISEKSIKFLNWFGGWCYLSIKEREPEIFQKSVDSIINSGTLVVRNLKYK